MRELLQRANIKIISKLRVATIALLLGVVGPLATVVFTGQAYAAPNFQMPFPCGETWWASTYANHKSIDWNIMGANDEGRSVVASLGGTATAGNSSSYGNFVLIDHGGGWKTRYAHLQETGVSGIVTQGQFIGKVGTTGNSTAPHLHWEQLYNNEKQDPLYANGIALQPGTAYNSSDPQYTSNNCGGPGTHTLGLKRGYTYFLNNGHDGIEETRFDFGNATDVPLAGDWDGDGTDTVGLKRGNTYFLNNGHDGIEEVQFSFGNATDIPIVGDWDGDGDDTIGLKRGNTYFLNNGNDGIEETKFDFGNAADLPLSGDWDGNRTDTIGLKRGYTYFLNNGNDGMEEIRFDFGSSTDTALAGDWDGNRTDTIGLKRGATYFLNNGNDGIEEVRFDFGNAADVPLAGDWDGQ